MASIELDHSIKLSLKHLHSSAGDSTEQLRLVLDDLIRQSYGNSKTLGNILPKKYLNEEKNESIHRNKMKTEKSSSSKTIAMQPHSPQCLQIPERQDDDSSNVMDGELDFDLLEEDLTCVVCRQIAVQAGNRLVECDACHALYHQDCHRPVISENDMNSANWQCATCLAAQGFPIGSSFSAVSKSTSANPVPISVKSSPNRHSTTSSSVKLSTSSSSSSSSKVMTPNINIISADKRLQIMKKKAAKQQEKRKHSKS